ncbi:TRAF-interacting protein with FHA domain-containing protein A isoform X2 [Mugil cephalus]|uniref:TRAF-interacting protein with FHA domain-containing protein A isoform X2 n=1 Tax=Mugil cephalus TaxID=48193 RepID=UPI001FB739FB|nr:TRAF-interacting protein with FHA domain-containing protein A isoform X2 [Mugil cephalus]
MTNRSEVPGSGEICFLFSDTAAAAPLVPSQFSQEQAACVTSVLRLKEQNKKQTISSTEKRSGLHRLDLFMMNVSQTIETEEDLLTCLHVKFYHPQQSVRPLYVSLPLRTRCRHQGSDPLRFGRDAQACTYGLNDPRVSRKQLALQAYRTPRSPDMLFSVQNLSERGQLSVNGAALGFLEKADLPNKALVRFGEYEVLIVREPGEARAHFEVEFEVLTVPPSRETCGVEPSATPVMDTGSGLANGLSANGLSASGSGVTSPGPLESDETLPCSSW